MDVVPSIGALEDEGSLIMKLYRFSSLVFYHLRTLQMKQNSKGIKLSQIISLLLLILERIRSYNNLAFASVDKKTMLM